MVPLPRFAEEDALSTLAPEIGLQRGGLLSGGEDHPYVVAEAETAKIVLTILHGRRDLPKLLP